MSPILEVKGLRTNYGKVNVLAGVDFTVQQGETYAIVGESGSGKTTVIRAIAGLAPSHAGSVMFDGREIRGASERAMRPLRKNISMMFQDPIGSLSPRLTIRNILTEPNKIQGMKRKDLDAEARRMLEMVNLPAHFADRYPYQLSGGQARRVGVARALALGPKLLLADEPTAGLDVSVQGELLNLLNDLRERMGLAMVIISHNLNVVRHVADRMGIMYLGRMVEEGTTEAIFRQPQHPYTQCLLSANPEPNPDAQISRLALKGEPPSLIPRPSGCEFRERCPIVSRVCSQVPPWKTGNGRGVRCFTPLKLNSEA
nr:ABC transporter ATP-binding protein [uncultured Roseovarius sp.]